MTPTHFRRLPLGLLVADADGTIRSATDLLQGRFFEGAALEGTLLSDAFEKLSRELIPCPLPPGEANESRRDLQTAMQVLPWPKESPQYFYRLRLVEDHSNQQTMLVLEDVSPFLALLSATSVPPSNEQDAVSTMLSRVENPLATLTLNASLLSDQTFTGDLETIREIGGDLQIATARITEAVTQLVEDVAPQRRERAPALSAR